MAEQVLAPIIPNLGPQAEAVAGSQGAVFTATDRQVIKERSGEVDPTKTFKEVFFKRDITHKVENEQSTINPEMDLRAMESRRKEHRKMLKYSAITAPREHVEISGEASEEAVVIAPPEVSLGHATAPQAPASVPVEAEKPAAPAEAAAVSQAEPADAFSQLVAEQNNLHSGLLIKIKELNLKRLFCSKPEEFEKLTVEIKNETLAASRPDARSYLEPKIDQLTKVTAEYKLKLMKSLETMYYEDENRKDTHWLQKIIDRYSAAA
jgi:hypothetical protein